MQDVLRRGVLIGRGADGDVEQGGDSIQTHNQYPTTCIPHKENMFLPEVCYKLLGSPNKGDVARPGEAEMRARKISQREYG